MVELSLRGAVDGFKRLPKPVQQGLVGTSSGWLSGFTLMKLGKSTSFSLGAAILMLQLGYHHGYIKVDWNSVNRDLKKAKEEVGKQASTHIPELHERVQSILKENVVVATTFVGGFLLGASTA